MTAEEIRKQQFECDSAEWECAKWLREIAAQLTELNQRFQPGAEGINVFANNDAVEAAVERIAAKLSTKETTRERYKASF